MATPITKKIGSTTFIIGHIPASEALLLAPLLAKAFGGPLAMALTAYVKANKPNATDEEKRAALMVVFADGALEKIVQHAGSIAPKDLESIVMKLAEATTIIGSKGHLRDNFDVIFTGNLKMMTKWIVESLKVNFGGFLESDGE